MSGQVVLNLFIIIIIIVTLAHGNDSYTFILSHPHNFNCRVQEICCVLPSHISCIQLFRERLSEKVHATIPKGIAGGFEFTVLQRKLIEWHERPWTYVCEC